MKSTAMVAAAIAVLVLSVSPAVARSPRAHEKPESSHSNKGKAYGKYCKGESKKHVKGQKGTPFSQCVTAMAKLAHGDTKSPKTACKALSHKHAKGAKGSPFSQCVSGGAKLLRDRE